PCSGFVKISLRLRYRIKSHVLHLYASNRDASVGPGHVGSSAQRGVVVVIASVARLYAAVVLGRLRDQLVADLNIRSPSDAVVSRLNAIAVVAASRIGGDVAGRGGLAPIVPGNGYLGRLREASQAVVDGKRWHPLRFVLAARIVVELYGRRPGLPVISR